MKCDLTALLDKAKDAGWINESEYGFLKCEYLRIAAFYILPKIHKEPKDNPLGRTIVSANGTLTKSVSQYIDYFLKTICAWTSILYTGHHTVTPDAESLYTNIVHSEGICASKYY